MVMKIGMRKTEQTPPSVEKELLDCHERIRSFVAMAGRLAAGTGSPAEEVREAAQRVRRYFAESLPRHSADEDSSIAPRLRESGAADVVAAMETVEKEHAETDAVLARLFPLWSELEASPEKIAEHAKALAEDSANLDAVFKRHLELEERVMIPAITRYFSREAQDAVLKEMRGRRTK